MFPKRRAAESNGPPLGHAQAMLITLVLAAAVVAGATACAREEGTVEDRGPTPEISAEAQPSPEAEGVATPEALATATATALPQPTPEPEDEYAGWLTYTNDLYGYEFRYPAAAEITEAPKEAFALPAEEYEQGVTLDAVYERYTGKICVTVWYELGYVVFSAPENRYVIDCLRTGRAYEGPERQETLLIDGSTYTASGFEEQGPGETLPYHNETLRVHLEDGTIIEYGSRPVETATFDEYLQIREDVLRIVQSYRQIQ